MPKKNSSKNRKPFGVEIRCPCGHVLGRFDAGDDHGCVIMCCPECNRALDISNGFLSELQSNPEDYDHPDWYQASEF